MKKHEFANAEWTDLVKEFEKASGQNLKEWANVWVKKAGLPIITPALELFDSNEKTNAFTVYTITLSIQKIFYRKLAKAIIGIKM